MVVKRAKVDMIDTTPQRNQSKSSSRPIGMTISETIAWSGAHPDDYDSSSSYDEKLERLSAFGIAFGSSAVPMDERMQLTDQAEKAFQAEFVKMVDRVTDIKSLFADQDKLAKLVIFADRVTK